MAGRGCCGESIGVCWIGDVGDVGEVRIWIGGVEGWGGDAGDVGVWSGNVGVWGGDVASGAGSRTLSLSTDHVAGNYLGRSTSTSTSTIATAVRKRLIHRHPIYRRRVSKRRGSSQRSARYVRLTQMPLLKRRRRRRRRRSCRRRAQSTGSRQENVFEPYLESLDALAVALDRGRSEPGCGDQRAALSWCLSRVLCAGLGGVDGVGTVGVRRGSCAGEGSCPRTNILLVVSCCRCCRWCA